MKKKKCVDHLGNEYESVIDMCRAYGISRNTYDIKSRMGLSFSEILELESSGMAVECIDHKGNKYKSISEMCSAYNINVSTYSSRRERGYSIMDALTMTVGYRKAKAEDIAEAVKDHLGNEYRSIHDMCIAYGTNTESYLILLMAGESIEGALTKHAEYNGEMHSTNCTDHLGNRYKSIAEMCDAYGISLQEYMSRVRLGWKTEDVLTKKEVKHVRGRCGSKICMDHLGNTYNSIKEMCSTYGVQCRTYRFRLESGWSLRDALTKETEHIPVECKDHLGNRYSSIREMCRAYGICSHTFSSRIRKGMSLKEALTKDIEQSNDRKRPDVSELNKKKCTDHLGNEYKSISDMCNAYGVKYATFKKRIMYGHSLEEALTGLNIRKMIRSN